MITHKFDIKLPKGEDSINLEMFCCAHVGSIAFDEDKFNQRIQRVLEEENRYLFFLGDTADAIFPTPDEKRYDPDTIDLRFYPPVNAYKYVRDKVAPIAKQKKIVLWHTGNHDDKLRLRSGTDYVQDYICDPLGIAYGGWLAYTNLFIHDKKTKYRYVINSNHGSYSGSKIGGALNYLEDRGRAYDCDILARGHSHKSGTTKTIKYYLDEEGNVQERKQLFVSVGSFHKSLVPGAALYSERKDYLPLKTGTVTVKIIPSQGDMVAIE